MRKTMAEYSMVYNRDYTEPGHEMPNLLFKVDAIRLATLGGVGDIDYDSVESEDSSMEEDYMLLKVLLHELQKEPIQHQNALYCEVAAKRLPTLVAKVKSKNKLAGSYLTLLNAISYTPYFAHYACSEAASGLAAILASRIAQLHDATDKMEVDSVDDDDDESKPLTASEIARAAELLATLLLVQGPEGISVKDKEAAIVVLERWRKQHLGKPAANMSERCLDLLRHPYQSMLEGGEVKGPEGVCLEDPLKRCGLASCRKFIEQKGLGALLLQCPK
ncbi:hypothetical protein FA15DRAFT_702911 [Coprinopsis marcescibilis]|uniref:Uncharacterized protein n=1 Tax=Coprinopsis marcescibilis TaxID=230819 RepID=A0A5C3L251_COPMA|nr:hypothetical protein FA15DRAFT_702911 [Coprinopsis marcescibilis]